jgi:hypothetical protein
MISVLSAAAVMLASSGDWASVAVRVDGMNSREARVAFGQAARAACLALEAPGTAYADRACVEQASFEAMRRFTALRVGKRSAANTAKVLPTLVAQGGR